MLVVKASTEKRRLLLNFNFLNFIFLYIVLLNFIFLPHSFLCNFLLGRRVSLRRNCDFSLYLSLHRSHWVRSKRDTTKKAGQGKRENNTSNKILFNNLFLLLVIENYQ